MLLALLRIDWNNPLSANLAANSTMSSILIDQDTLAALPRSTSSITANIKLNIPIAAAAQSNANLNSRLGLSLASNPNAAASGVSDLKLNIPIAALAGATSFSFADLYYTWNKHGIVIDTWVKKSAANTVWSKKSTSTNWSRKNLSNDIWVRKDSEPLVEGGIGGLLALSWAKRRPQDWVRRHG